MSKFKKDGVVMNTVYDTIILRGNKDRLSGIPTNIKRSVILENDDVVKNTKDNIFTVIGEQPDIPFFKHPYHSAGQVYIDGRPFLNKAGQFKIGQGYPDLQLRAYLELMWVTNPGILRDGNIELLVDIWSSWVSNALAIKLNLNPFETMLVKVVCAIYYFAKLNPYSEDVTEEFLEDINLSILKVLPRSIRVSADMINDNILSTLDKKILSFYDNADAFLAFIRCLETILNNEYTINTALIYNACTSGIFIGDNAAEISASALEHVPSFYFMINTVLYSGIQNKTTLGRLIGASKKRHNLNKFEQTIKYTISELE